LPTQCRALAVVPARNEEAALPATLAALRRQRSLDGSPLPPCTYGVLLLLNNCTDGSRAVAETHAATHPHPRLQIAACHLLPGEAHVGTARRILMDAACVLFESHANPSAPRVILSTDADTLVAPDWIAANLREIDQGADAVGGAIDLLPEDLAALDPGTRLAYERDRRLQALVARFESILDPDPADPWPRHLQHFGASLACTAEIYRRAGGLPAVQPLEDVAFVDRLRTVDARLRHSPAVRIQTSARLEGRAQVGLSGQLRLWREEAAAGLPQMVDSAEWMEHRFRWMGRLRRLHALPLPLPEEVPARWRERFLAAHGECLPMGAFLARLDCDGLIAEDFHEERRGEIRGVMARLEQRLAFLGEAQSCSSLG
jgi:hypothetical protein